MLESDFTFLVFKYKVILGDIALLYSILIAFSLGML